MIEGREGHGDLEHGTGWIPILKGSILERIIGMVEQHLPFVGIDARGEPIGIKARRRRQRQDFALPRVERDDSAHLALQQLGGLLLEIQIESQRQRLPTHRRLTLDLFDIQRP